MVPNSETDCTNSTSTSWYQTNFSSWEADTNSAAWAFCIMVSGKESMSAITQQTASHVLKSYRTAITVRQYRQILQITAGQNKPLPKAKEAPQFLAYHLLMPLYMYVPFPSPSSHLCKLSSKPFSCLLGSGELETASSKESLFWVLRFTPRRK